MIFQCTEPAARFFHCFSEEGRQVDGSGMSLSPHCQDALAGVRAVKKCRALMKAYDECMQKHS
jgi:hypothetical protein